MKTTFKRTLILPLVASGTSTVFRYDNDRCMINCVDALSSLNISKFDEIYIILDENVDKILKLQEKISADMSRIDSCDFKFILLPKMTSSPAETIYNALCEIGWEDRMIFIKDGDNKFRFYNMLDDGNYIMTSSLEQLEIVDPQHKSYVRLDEQGFVTNCIEKRIISDKFIAGGYCFRNAELFKEAYEELKKYNKTFYISDIIYWLVLNKEEKFRPVYVDNFRDFNLV